jgi:molybdopterin converting factor small subunit
VREVKEDGISVGELLGHLGVRDKVCDERGALRRHFSVHVNDGEDVRFLDGLDTSLKDGDRVMIISAIAGG